MDVKTLLLDDLLREKGKRAREYVERQIGYKLSDLRSDLVRESDINKIKEIQKQHEELCDIIFSFKHEEDIFDFDLSELDKYGVTYYKSDLLRFIKSNGKDTVLMKRK